MNPKTQGTSPAIGNKKELVSGTTYVYPQIQKEDGKPIYINTAGFEFVVADDDVTVFHKSRQINVLTINKTEIIIGNPNGEHIRLKI